MYIKYFLIAIVIFFTIDLLWIGVLAKNLYSRTIGHLLADTVNWPAAIAFYVIYMAGLVFFVIAPAIDKQSLAYAMGVGAFFGLVMYATFDLTSFALLKDWPLSVTIIDLLWGMFISSSVASLTYVIAQKFL